jgi:hypothetical protein
VELADRALSDPVLGPALRRLGDILGGISLGDGGLLVAALAFILDGRLLVFVLVLLVFGALVDEALGWGAAFGAVLRAAADGEGVAIGPFNVDVLLLDSRQLAVQLVGVLHLLDVKLGREGAQAGVEAAEVVLPRRLIVVVNETEDRENSWKRGKRDIVRAVVWSGALDTRRLSCCGSLWSLGRSDCMNCCWLSCSDDELVDGRMAEYI